MSQSSDRNQMPYQGRRITGDNANTIFGPQVPAVLVAGRSETVIIETQDCYGGRLSGDTDAHSAPETDKLNPVTGPLYIEGAEPSDVLCIHIQDIKVAERGVAVLRPKSGFLGSEIRKPHVYQVEIQDNRVVINQDVSVPLRPVVGIIGVAPRHGDIKTEYPGRHGGNMDTLEVTIGSRLFLPVQVKGALLSLGSVKACMGDGEVTGAGVEVAAEVTVRVDILPGGRYSWPRLETKDEYIALASASSVDQASKLAVMEMVRWLEQEKGLDFETAYLLTGISGDLRISQWSNPLMTARMIIPRAVMNKIQRRAATGTRPIHMSVPEDIVEEIEEPETSEVEEKIETEPPTEVPSEVDASEAPTDQQPGSEASEGEGEETKEKRPESSQRKRRWRRRRRPSGARKRKTEGATEESKDTAASAEQDAQDNGKKQQSGRKKPTEEKPREETGEAGAATAPEGTPESDAPRKPKSSYSRRRRGNRRPRTYRRKPRSNDGDKPDAGGGGGDTPPSDS